jgi:hypothetical protein
MDDCLLDCDGCMHAGYDRMVAEVGGAGLGPSHEWCSLTPGDPSVITSSHH